MRPVPVLLAIEVDLSRLSILRDLLGRINGTRVLAQSNTLADLMNEIENEEIRRCHARRAAAQKRIDLADDQGDAPIVVDG